MAWTMDVGTDALNGGKRCGQPFRGGRSTATITAFADEGDMILLGAHGLEGLNMRVDLVARELVPAGPVPAAAAA